MLSGEVEVRLWRRCSAPECAAARSDPADTCLGHLPPADLDRQLKRFRRGRPLDARGLIISEELLGLILDSAPVDSVGRRRLSTARFDSAVFHCDVVLDETWFGLDASFQQARFTGALSFRNVRVLRQTSFAQARFEGEAYFDGARLDGPATFTGAEFQRGASFAGAAFGGPAWFTTSGFGSDGIFRGATFARHASFRSAAFYCHGDFSGTTFEADAEFADSRFANPPDFGSATFKGREGLPEVAMRNEVNWWGPPLAGWSHRAIAALWDLALPTALVAVALLTIPTLNFLSHSDLVKVVPWFGPLAAGVYVLRNAWFQGDTGQSMGKGRVGLRLLDERDRRPPGSWRSLARQMLHILDIVSLVGWLRPLRDEKRQTFADKIMGTVVVVVGENWRRANTDDAVAAAAAVPGFG